MFIEVRSSNINKIKTENNDLLIMFNDGSQYKYFGAGSYFDGIISSESKGKYFHQNIKNNFNFERIK